MTWVLEIGFQSLIKGKKPNYVQQDILHKITSLFTARILHPTVLELLINPNRPPGLLLPILS